MAVAVDGYSGPRAGGQLVRRVTPERAWGGTLSHRRCVACKQVKMCHDGFVLVVAVVVVNFFGTFFVAVKAF